MSALHKAFSRCRTCGKLLPHDGLVCPCGMLGAVPEVPKDTQSGRMQRLLRGLAEGIGWQYSTDRLTAVGLAGVIYITLVHRFKIHVRAEDILTGHLIREYDGILTWDQELRSIANACIQYVANTYGHAVDLPTQPYRLDEPTVAALAIGQFIPILCESPEEVAMVRSEARKEIDAVHWTAESLRPRYKVTQKGLLVTITRIA